MDESITGGFYKCKTSWKIFCKLGLPYKETESITNPFERDLPLNMSRNMHEVPAAADSRSPRPLARRSLLASTKPRLPSRSPQRSGYPRSTSFSPMVTRLKVGHLFSPRWQSLAEFCMRRMLAVEHSI